MGEATTQTATRRGLMLPAGLYPGIVWVLWLSIACSRDPGPKPEARQSPSGATSTGQLETRPSSKASALQPRDGVVADVWPLDVDAGVSRPGAPIFESHRTEILARAKSVPGFFASAPAYAPPADPPSIGEIEISPMPIAVGMLVTHHPTPPAPIDTGAVLDLDNAQKNGDAP